MRSLAVSIFVGVFLSLWAQSPVSLQEQIFYARDRVLPALVHIEPIKKVYTRGEKQHTLVTGSGFIFSREGYVMTNHHVAANAEKVWCTLYNKERITATVVGSDQSTDIAILKLNLEELQDTTFAVATLGNSDSLEVGQIVLALGSPLGLSRSVSMGVVSSIDRYFPTRGTSMDSPYNLWIQTDAAINPGNSGGPLINLHGEVVGINARAVFLAENLGFAIPINLAREIAAQILERSSVKRAWLGADFKPIKDLREYLEMPHLSGVLVTHVERNSPAEKVGLQPGDVIRQIGDQPVNALFEEDLPGIRKIIATLPIGEKIPLHIWRNGKSKTLRVAVIEEPLDSDAPEIEAEEWGLVVRGLSWQAYRVQLLPDFNGVEITSVKPAGPGEQANLRSGDVIRKINGVVVKNGKHFRELYEAWQDTPEQPVFMELVRDAHPYFAVLKLRLTAP